MKNLLKFVFVACAILAPLQLSPAAFAASDGESLVNEETVSISKWIEQLTAPELSWETRIQAEERLKTFDAQSVLLLLMPYVTKGTLGGLTLVSGLDQVKFSKKLPPQWQIYYAVQRVWHHHEKELQNANTEQLAPLRQKLLTEVSDNPSSKIWVASRFMYGAPALWTDETETAFAVMMRDSESTNNLRSIVIEGLINKTGAKYYKEAKAIIKGFPENTSDEIFAKAKSLDHLLWNVSLQKNEKTGQLETDKELLKTAFELLPKMEQIRKGGGYFLALRLADYVGQKFVADQKNPKYQQEGNLSADFFGDTTANALAWWEKDKQ